MKNLGDMARRILSQHQHGQEQQPEGNQQYTPAQPQHPGEEEDALPPRLRAYTGQGQPQIVGERPHPDYQGEPPNLRTHNPEGARAIPTPAPASGDRPIAMHGVAPPNPCYTPPQGDRPQGDAPQSYLPRGPQSQEPYPPQGSLPQQQGGGGFLSGTGRGILSGLAGGFAGSMIGNAIFGAHGQSDAVSPREEIMNDAQAPQGVLDLNTGFDLDAGGWDSAGRRRDDCGADWVDDGGWDTFGGDDEGWV